MGRDLFRPPDPLPVSEWAARFFHIDKTSPSPGLYDPTTTPWINAILDEYPDPNLTQIVLGASAQSSKTQPAIICLQDQSTTNQTVENASVSCKQSSSRS